MQAREDVGELIDHELAVKESLLANMSSTSGSDQPQGEVVCWLLDTRTMWPGQKISSATGAAECMALITPAEQKTVSGRMFIADAKMSLASALLKRLFITKALGIPWSDVRLGRKDDPKTGKPCAVDEYGDPIEGIDFNVSHQAGLVSLTGWNGRQSGSSSSKSVASSNTPDVMVGADIVCVNERNAASSTINTEGLEAWINIYDSVFSEEERRAMKYEVDYVTLQDGTTVTAAELGSQGRFTAKNQILRLSASDGRDLSFSSNLLVDAKLRRFYAYFCYKEAYIKLSGEALLAPWLRELEFSNVRSPKPAALMTSKPSGPWGEEVDDVQVRLRGRLVHDVKMKLQAFEDKFMLASSIQGAVENLHIPSIKCLDLQTDVLPFARKD